MIIRKSFQFRLKLTKKQARILDTQLEECRWLYNELLAQRKLAHEDLEISLTNIQQLMFLPELKIERPSLEKVHSQVLQNVVDRLDKAFQGFFRRCKQGEKPGFPRFRGEGRYNSLCYPQSGFKVIGKELKLSKVGCLRILYHRPIEGNIKTCTLKKNASGSWDVSFSCEVDVQPKAPVEKSVGIDVGLTQFATLSDGKEIENPRYFKKSEKALAKSQRQCAKLAKKTPERRKKIKAIARIHEHIGNQRRDFCHKESKKIVDEYQYICVEDLAIGDMIAQSPLSKSIADASRNQFCRYLSYKAEEAGRKMGLVNPAYTTQDCSRCGNREPKALSDRSHHCERCGYKTTRDFNAAQNILALGLDGLGVNPRSLRL